MMSVASLLKTIVMYACLLVACVAGGLTWVSVSDRAVDYQVAIDDLILPQFDEQIIDFIPSYDKTKTLPFTAGAIIDLDNDGIEELFIGGGMYQQDAFFRYENGRFSDISSTAGWQKKTPDKTFGAVSLDLDSDGDSDMLVSRQSGVWLYRNQDGAFEGQMLDLDLHEETVPLSVAIADLNRDGLYDLFVAGYIARRFVQGETIFNQQYGGISGLYLNMGDDTFKNITVDAGMEYQHNTFMGVFLDVDDDGLEDLIVAHDTGQVRTWKNLGDLKFENRSNPTSDYFSYPMSIAVTDYRNDGSPDFYFSNVGSTTPDFLVRGDLREDQTLNKKWIFFENEGNFVFSDAASESKLADYEFSWGAVFEDFNLDGLDDLVVSENYVGYPLHMVPFWRLDGRFLLQTTKGEFAEVSDAINVRNREFGITPLTADFNQDGYPDLVHVNLLGPQKVFLSRAGEQGFLKVRLENRVQSIGARVSVKLDDGTVLHQSFVVGEGLLSDQSHVLIFGLGAQSASTVSVRWLDGRESQMTGPYRNEIVVP